MQFLSQLESHDGIWFSKSTNKISYPEEGNNFCFQIEDSSYWFRHRNQFVKTLVGQYGVDGLFADVGGGNGFVTKALENTVSNVVLIEPGKMGCINAKQRGVDNVVCARFEDIDWSHGELDNVGIFDVLEHIEDDLGFLDQLNNALSSKGRLFITVPAFKFLWSKDDIYAGHFRRYTKKSIERLLNKAGFKVIYKSYLFSPLVVPLFFARTIPSILGARKVNIQNNSSEHGTSGGVFVRILNSILKIESNWVSKKKTIPLGTSLIVCCEKV